MSLNMQDFAHIAQVVEHFLGKEEVTGSSPVVGTTVYVYNRKIFNIIFKREVYFYGEGKI